MRDDQFASELLYTSGGLHYRADTARLSKKQSLQDKQAVSDLPVLSQHSNASKLHKQMAFHDNKTTHASYSATISTVQWTCTQRLVKDIMRAASRDIYRR